MEYTRIIYSKEEDQRYVGASIFYWLVFVLTAVVLFRFWQTYTLGPRACLGIIVLLLPYGWFYNYRHYQHVREVYRNVANHTPEFEEIYGSLVRSLGRQLGLQAGLLGLMLQVLVFALIK